MGIIIEVCDYNLLSAMKLEEIFDRPDVAVMSYDCMNFCGMCSMGPYAMVNGKRVFGKTIDDCISKIKATVEKELQELDNLY
ncbi:DUF1450 domain-containing protein [Oceanobacillus chungangensis]|uniref:DUF1450 domain-containing protein n=1 Tax=Oceanobacillus chungangensis TaxID=1229152 RepID=A0A3D8PTF5_9BACI|nr:DUF1450 domain-containing protein [Oceanobacillus chungangensis]RDW19406.1 hypothetical protein CWR45_08215 [Oceanobacillus chungangensis]